MTSLPTDADQLYVDTLTAMTDPRDRMRFRDLVYHLMREEKERVDPSHHEALWPKVVTAAVWATKTWVTAKEREKILAKIEAGNDEYEEAIASQEAVVAPIPSR